MPDENERQFRAQPLAPAPLANICDEIGWLIGDVTAPLVAATVTTAYLEVVATQEGDHRG